MTRRSVLIAIALVSIGIVFGAVVVTSFSGINLSLAGPSTSFNTTPPYTPSEGVASLNDAFTSVSTVVTPSVVYISVKAKAERPQGGFWPFGDMLPRDGQEQEQLQPGTGSGIILTEDGYILTNRHVIANAIDDGIKVTLFDSREFTARLVGEDKNTDIAVIKVDASRLPMASLGNSDAVRVGEWVLAVGNPLGLTSTVTAGIISAISRNIGIMRQTNNDGYGIENFIQTDAAINPGNSGGALVNLQGQVIGVNTAIASNMGRYMGYGFAVPINLARVVADALIKEGRFVRGYIGVRISDLDAKGAKAVGLDRYNGVLVNSLVEGGAGEAAGLKPGDVIVEVEGKDVASSNQLQARVGMHHPGDVVALKIWRDGAYKDVKVKLKGRDGEEDAIASDDASSKAKSRDNAAEARVTASFDKAGFTVKGLDDEAKKTFKRSAGVIVTDVKRYSKAWDSMVRAGIVIFEARQGSKTIAIESVSDLKKVLGGLKSDDAILLRVALENGDTTFITLEGPIE